MSEYKYSCCANCSKHVATEGNALREVHCSLHDRDVKEYACCSSYEKEEE